MTFTGGIFPVNVGFVNKQKNNVDFEMIWPKENIWRKNKKVSGQVGASRGRGEKTRGEP